MEHCTKDKWNKSTAIGLYLLKSQLVVKKDFVLNVCKQFLMIFIRLEIVEVGVAQQIISVELHIFTSLLLK